MRMNAPVFCKIWLEVFKLHEDTDARTTENWHAMQTHELRRGTVGDTFINPADEDNDGAEKPRRSIYFGGVWNGTKNWK
jgi:hypothetical protein